jgi:hypothetical protein
MSEDYSEEQLIDLKKEVPRLEEKFREVRGYTEAQNTQDTLFQEAQKAVTIQGAIVGRFL